MSARKQLDKNINQIILKGFDLLKFTPIFKCYDKHCSVNNEYFGAITHSNELQQLRDNIYYPQTEKKEALKTHYTDIFKEIAKSTLNLERHTNITKDIIALKEQLAKLELGRQYLKDNVFSISKKNLSTRTRALLDKKTLQDFINVKARLVIAINRYLNTLPHN